jgi:hypothetical protein
MWVDSDGVGHTVALPDPESRLDPSFLRVVRTHFGELDEDFLDDFEGEIIGESVARLRPETRVGKPLPNRFQIGTGLDDLGKPVSDLLRDAVRNLPVRWRLDALLVTVDAYDAWRDTDD